MVPKQLPLVVRESRLKRALVLGAAPLVMMVVAACPVALVFQGGTSDAGGLAMFLTIASVVVAGVSAVRWWMTTASGPVLGASPDGVWVRLDRTRGAAIFLPWSEIAWVRSENLALTRVLRIEPRRTQQVAGILHVPIAESDRSEHEVVATLKRYGRQTAFA